MTWKEEHAFKLNFQKFGRELLATTERIQSAQIIAKALNGPKMGKLTSVAQRIAETKKHLESEADKLLSRLDELDSKAPQAFAKSNAIIDSHSADLDVMEQELRQLTNE